MSKKQKKSGVHWLQLVDFKSVVMVLVLFAVAIGQGFVTNYINSDYPVVSLEDIPAWDGEPYIEIDGNVPVFTTDEAVTHAFEEYARLDDWGRCGPAYACVNQRLMPDEERGSISSVTPSGWVNHSYDFVDGGYVYNRCHLIGFQLTGENANERNLITGTRYMNVQGMLPFENMVADHIKEEDHHVLYRVQPVFNGEELVCRGVQMEAFCVECARNAESDEDKFMFNVYCYNVQPGVVIDYATGENWLGEMTFEGAALDYVLNTSSMKFHDPDCSGAQGISEENREEITCTRDELIYKGYEPCGSCKP